MEIRVLSNVGIMKAIVDWIRCNCNVFNKDGVYGRDSVLSLCPWSGYLASVRMKRVGGSR